MRLRWLLTCLCVCSALKIKIAPGLFSKREQLYILHPIMESVSLKKNQVNPLRRILEFPLYNYQQHYDLIEEPPWRIEELKLLYQDISLHLMLFGVIKLITNPPLTRWIFVESEAHPKYSASLVSTGFVNNIDYPPLQFKDEYLHDAIINYIVSDQLDKVEQTDWLVDYLNVASIDRMLRLVDKLTPGEMVPNFLIAFLGVRPDDILLRAYLVRARRTRTDQLMALVNVHIALLTDKYGENKAWTSVLEEEWIQFKTNPFLVITGRSMTTKEIEKTVKIYFKPSTHQVPSRKLIYILRSITAGRPDRARVNIIGATILVCQDHYEQCYSHGVNFLLQNSPTLMTPLMTRSMLAWIPEHDAEQVCNALPPLYRHGSCFCERKRKHLWIRNGPFVMSNRPCLHNRLISLTELIKISKRLPLPTNLQMFDPDEWLRSIHAAVHVYARWATDRLAINEEGYIYSMSGDLRTDFLTILAAWPYLLLNGQRVPMNIILPDDLTYWPAVIQGWKNSLLNNSEWIAEAEEILRNSEILAYYTPGQLRAAINQVHQSVDE